VTQLTALVENMAPQINKTKALAFIANNFSWYSIVNRLVKAMAQ
jgi:hypothetical protein